MPINVDCFKAYGIRGRIPDQLNADIAYRICNAGLMQEKVSEILALIDKLP